MTAPMILWFKRDLRIADHPALARAAAMGPVLPVYVAEPPVWQADDASRRQWAFVAESLAELRGALGRLGQPLIVRMGEAVPVLAALAEATGAREIFSHQETGTSLTFARDRAVAAWARAVGIRWTELPQSGVVRRLATRDGWARHRDAFVAGRQAAAPCALAPLPGIDPGAIPSAADLGLTPDPCRDRQTGGRAAGLDLLKSFLSGRARTYRRDMSSPVTGEAACSRLSPHLAWGTLSLREADQAAQAPTERGMAAGITSFRSRLAWRDHFIQKLEDAPDLAERCLHAHYENLRPRDADMTRLRAWQSGETGLPFADACMRYLNATGWLNFRMRSMLMAVASYHLWLDWRATGPHLARMFTDYEPGIHWAQAQMQSGVTGINLPRIYNPVKQGTDQDPTGTFTRRWCPELAGVPDRFLQTPWLWPEAGGLLGRTYPEPVVDPVAAAKAAREAVWAVRQGSGFAAEASRVVRQHASPADKSRRFVNDRAEPVPRAKAQAATRQMSFDL
jgi:deoxyribodipyrimidine photo-lyase